MSIVKAFFHETCLCYSLCAASPLVGKPLRYLDPSDPIGDWVATVLCYVPDEFYSLNQRSENRAAIGMGAVSMKHFYILFFAFFAWFTVTQAAAAQEIFVGVAAHEVDTPLSMQIDEEGVDFQLGYRGKRIEALAAIGAPSPYIFASVNSAGDTSLVAAGLSWKIGNTFYLRPGIGLAIHDGPSLRFAPDGSQTQLGSRILFEPELAIGVQLSERIDLEASWVHVSHAQLFNDGQNPGLDIIGARLVIKLP